MAVTGTPAVRLPGRSTSYGVKVSIEVDVVVEFVIVVLSPY
jgi:hypothetical protein